MYNHDLSVSIEPLALQLQSYHGGAVMLFTYTGIRQKLVHV